MEKRWDFFFFNNIFAFSLKTSAFPKKVFTCKTLAFFSRNSAFAQNFFCVHSIYFHSIAKPVFPKKLCVLLQNVLFRRETLRFLAKRLRFYRETSAFLQYISYQLQNMHSSRNFVFACKTSCKIFAFPRDTFVFVL